MKLPGLDVMRMVPERSRVPQANIPQTLAERERLRAIVARYVAERRERLVPPLVLEELRTHADRVATVAGIDPGYRDYAGVLLNNEVWREALAAIPYDRRLLLLPKCLRVEDKCPAPFDEFGLLCKQCGLCTIQDLQNEAERLGYAVLVAEGSAIVMSLIQTGKIDAIVGVSCLSVLERAFPYMEAAAVPGVAIPLLQDDCKDTTVDLDWVWDVIHASSDDRTRRLDLDGLRCEVEGWFEPATLDRLLGGPPSGPADRVARAWLTRAGKRWRPFLAACAFKAWQDDPSAPLPDAIKRVAVAVECFHKASLVHDDIEDGDATRYGEQALHVEHGVPVALNAGDLLIGEGYRLLAECDAPPAVRAALVRIAAEGHRQLCLGQGAELDWAHHPRVLGAAEVLEIFRRKTSPAFEVALRLGAALAGAPDDVHETLTRYSDALGVAYQIRDDIEDLDAADAPNGVQAMRPSLPLALACERATGTAKARLQQAWLTGHPADVETLRRLVLESGAADRCRMLVELYKEQAIQTLPELQNASVKGLLRRVVGKIFRVEIQGWCSEFEARNAAGGAVGAAAAG
ncbi:MAG: polyprenyl synthetase family protein [Acidobacteria bacterium]|nr:polyprenyl synthetase family protein [Acidobacteriota bacterium]